MVPTTESRKGTTEGGEGGSLEPTPSKKRKKARVAVSIRKGNLLFFPTAPTDVPDVTQVEDKPTEPRSDPARALESEGG